MEPSRDVARVGQYDSLLSFGFQIGMASRRLADTPTPARRRQAQPSLPMPPDDSGRTARDLLLNSWPGRLFIIAALLKLLVVFIRLFGDVPAFLSAASTAATVALAFSVLFFLTRLVFLVQRRLLWRVRRKLILSYIFIGVVPSLLILGFFLLSTAFVAGAVGAYLFRDGYDDVTRQIQLLAEAATAEIGRSPRTTEETVDRVRRNGAASLGYPTLSMVFIPALPSGPAAVSRGPWEHLRGLTEPTALAQPWIRSRPEGFAGTTAVTPPDAPGEPELVIRAVRPAGRAEAPIGWVIVDLPLDSAMLTKLYERTGVKAGAVTLSTPNADGTVSSASVARASGTSLNSFSLFRNTVSLFDAYDWATGEPLRATVPLTFRMGELFERLSDAQSMQLGSVSLGDAFRFFLVVVAVLFLIIELVALVMGLALARSITSSIHELFMGTERVRQGDFTHRISINTKDQLGELAGSFNQMTGSIENLLQTAAEKKRLEEELRIARADPDVAPAARPARHAGPRRHGALRAGARGGRRLLRLLPARSGPPRRAHRRRGGQGHVGGALHGRAQGPHAGAQPDVPEPAPAPHRGQPHPLRQPRQPQLHHDDLRRHRPRQRRDDLRAGGPHAAHLPARAVRGDAGRPDPHPERDGAGPAHRRRGGEVRALLEEEQIPLHTGDVLVFYTDGITEAMNTESDLFGDARLSQIVEEHGHLDSGELRERILREIEAFVGTRRSARRHDDDPDQDRRRSSVEEVAV